jgi:hypothetical protein
VGDFRVELDAVEALALRPPSPAIGTSAVEAMIEARRQRR